MNTKSLFLLPAAALAFCIPKPANAYVGFGLNFSVPLFYPAPYYSAPTGYARTVVYAAPPRAEGEQVTAAPGPGYVWMAGHWSNVSQRWVWVAGHWEMPPSPSALWTGGHWIQGNGGWVWVDGAWTIGTNSVQPTSAPPVPPGPQAPQGAVAAPPAPPSAAPAPSTPAPAPEMADGTEVGDEPPAPIQEYVPVAPYPDYVWIGGFWGWRGGWYWNSGHYAPRPYRGAAWVSGGWGHVGGRWAWHGGRWR